MRFRLLEYDDNHTTKILADREVTKLLNSTHKEADELMDKFFGTNRVT